MHHPQGQLNLFDNDEERDICTIGANRHAAHANEQSFQYKESHLFMFFLVCLIGLYLFLFLSFFVYPYISGVSTKKKQINKIKKPDRNEQMNKKK